MLAVSLPPEALNSVGGRLYKRFRTSVPDGAQGWGAKREPCLERSDRLSGSSLKGEIRRPHATGCAAIRAAVRGAAMIHTAAANINRLATIIGTS